MAVNKKTARKSAPKAKAFVMTPTRRTNIAAARNAAFNSSTSRGALLAAIMVACGTKPEAALAEAVRTDVVLGLMAGALAAKGDNRERDAIIADCRVKLNKYQGHGGEAKLRKGMLGRRSEVEEKAYASARVQWSTLCRDAGVTLPPKSGSNSKGRKPNAGKVKGKAAANDQAPATPRFGKRENLVAFALKEAMRLQTVLNRSAKCAPPQLSSAIQDFYSAVKALAPAAE